jgi:hypothetical protein
MTGLTWAASIARTKSVRCLRLLTITPWSRACLAINCAVATSPARPVRRSPQITVATQGSSSWILPNHHISQREPLIRIIRNCCIHRGMSNCNTRRRSNHPPNMLIRSVPHLDPEGEVARDVVEVWVGQLPEQLIHSKVRRRACTPKALRCFAKLLQHSQRMELTFVLVHENTSRT